MRWFLGFLVMATGGACPAAAEPTLKEGELIAALIESLDDVNSEVRLNIAAALANLGDAPVPALIDALAHPKAERRMGAALALGQIRSSARDAIPALLQAMKDKDEGVRRCVSYALSRIVGRDAPPARTGERLPNIPPPDPTPTSAGASR